MFDRDKWQEIFHAMAMNKMRTILTGLGVMWGMYMLLILLGSGSGLKNGATNEFGNFATNSLFLWTQRTTVAYDGLPKGRSFDMENADIQALYDHVPGVAVVAARATLGGYRGQAAVKRGKYSGSYEVSGEVPDIFKIMPRKVVTGRLLNELDQQEKRKVCVIGKRVRDVLFEADEDPIGEYISIQGVYFRVIGVFDLFLSGGRSEGELEKIFVPFATYQQSYNMVNVIGHMSIMAEPGVSVEQMEKDIIDYMKTRHRIAPEDTRAFGAWNMEQEISKINGLFMGINLLIWIVGTGTLLAGVIGVSNIMLVVVKERTKEIGVRKALGATPFAVVSQVVLEAIVLTAIAGCIGLVVGVGTVEGLNYLLVQANLEGQMFSNPVIDFQAVSSALLILIAAGALAGWLPSLRAARVNPIIALRT